MANHRLVSPVQVADLLAYESGKYIGSRMANPEAHDVPELRWPMEQLRELFYGGDTTWYNWHGLMLVTDFWGNYRRSCHTVLKVKTDETYDERRRRIQEIRRYDVAVNEGSTQRDQSQAGSGDLRHGDIKPF